MFNFIDRSNHISEKENWRHRDYFAFLSSHDDSKQRKETKRKRKRVSLSTKPLDDILIFGFKDTRIIRHESSITDHPIITETVIKPIPVAMIKREKKRRKKTYSIEE